MLCCKISHFILLGFPSHMKCKMVRSISFNVFSGGFGMVVNRWVILGRATVIKTVTFLSRVCFLCCHLCRHFLKFSTVGSSKFKLTIMFSSLVKCTPRDIADLEDPWNFEWFANKRCVCRKLPIRRNIVLFELRCNPDNFLKSLMAFIRQLKELC